jgi:hypothetical protein
MDKLFSDKLGFVFHLFLFVCFPLVSKKPCLILRYDFPFGGGQVSYGVVVVLVTHKDQISKCHDGWRRELYLFSRVAFTDSFPYTHCGYQTTLIFQPLFIKIGVCFLKPRI